MIKQKILLLIIILGLFLLSGCWDRIEPEKQAVVVGGGFDYNVEEDMYKVVFQIASPLTMKGAGAQGGSTDKPNFWTVSAWGHSPYDAIANLNKKVSRRVTFAHAKLYVFTEKMAREKGILPILNAVARSRQSRRIIIIAVVKGDVEELLTVRLPIESSNVIGLTNQINLTMESMGGAAAQDARDFFIKLTQPGLEPYVVALELINTEEEDDPSKDPPVRITGKYIFKHDKVVGSLNDRETRGCNWIVGQVKSGTLVLTYPDKKNVKIDILASEGSSKIIPIVRDGEPIIKLEIKASGRIVNITGLGDLKGESALTKSLNKRMAQVIKNDIKLALDKAQSLASDVFGFGFAFYRLLPDRWGEMADDWEQIFSNLQVEIDVKVDILNVGLVNKGPDIE